MDPATIIFIALPVLLTLGLVARCRAARSRKVTDRRIADALDRVIAGETGVRLTIGGSARGIRLASGFNALVKAHEAGDPPDASLTAPATFQTMRRLERGPSAEAGGHFIAIVEIERFAMLRRGLGTRLANEVVSHVARQIHETLEECDIGRMNRTTIEFGFRSQDADTARTALGGLIERLEQRITLQGFTFDLPISIGFTDADGRTVDEELIDEAAAALAEAHTRRTKLAFADRAAPAEENFHDLALVRDLPRAMAQGELRLFYQPKLRSRTNRIDSAEALLRWWHPQHGQVPTAKLIELAEGTGAIRDLSEWVIAQAVTDRLRLMAAGHDVVVYVNISGVLLPDRGFARRALQLVSAAPGGIGFEITETAVIEDPDGALANLHAFREAGIRIAIDDYGSGLSSLAYLKQLPAHELKIDRLFVSGLTSSNRDPLLVRSSIDLAHALDMEVTAEGVDDPLALSLLRVMGCDMVQGYLISPALAFDEFTAFLIDTAHLETLGHGIPGLAFPSAVTNHA